MHRICRRVRGFSLPEVVIAVFVICVAMVTFIPCFIQGRAAVRKSQRVEQAGKIANAELETWRHAGYAKLPAIPVGQASVTKPLSVGNPMPSGSGSVKFTHVDSTLAPSSVDTGLEQVDVVTSWDDHLGDKGTIAQTALISKP